MKIFGKIMPRGKKTGPALPMALAALAAAAVFGQSSESLRFIPAELDYGTIRETDGKARREVKAVNISADTTFIISARTSCGCSAAEYSPLPIAPGDTTGIYITYDPTDRPGRFLKTVKIFTGADRMPNSFKLKGMVIPSKKNLDRAYPCEAKNLRLSTVMVNAGELRRNESRPLFVGIYNNSDSPVTVAGDSDSDALSVRVLPDTIEPFGVSTATLMLRTGFLPDNSKDINLNAYLINSAAGDTIIRIPVGGMISDNPAGL